MESVGKGRLTSQDASFNGSNGQSTTAQSIFASKLALKRRSLAHIFDESAASNSEKRNRIRSNSLGAAPAPPMPTVPANYTNGNNIRPPIKKRFSVSRLLSSGKDTSTLLSAPSARKSCKSTPSNSRPTSAYGPGMYHTRVLTSQSTRKLMPHAQECNSRTRLKR